MELGNITPVSRPSSRVATVPTDNPLYNSEFIRNIAVPDARQEWDEGTSREGAPLLFSASKVGYIELTDGSRVHPLQILAQQSISQLADVQEAYDREYKSGKPYRGDKGKIADGDAAFMSPTVDMTKMAFVSSGQHARNKDELLIYNYRTVFTDNPGRGRSRVQLTEKIYTDESGSVLYIKTELPLADMPDDAKQYYPIYASEVAKLVRRGKEFMYKTDDFSVCFDDLYGQLASKYWDLSRTDLYQAYFDEENGKSVPFSKAQMKALERWFLLSVPEPDRFEYRYSLDETKPRFETRGNVHWIHKPLGLPQKPKKPKPKQYDAVVGFMQERFPEVEMLMAAVIARGFDIEWTDSDGVPKEKETIHVLNAVSNWGKSSLLVEPLRDIGVATTSTVSDILGLLGKGARMSGANPAEIGSSLLLIVDEFVNADKKEAVAFHAELKNFHTGMAMRTLHSSTVYVRGQSLLLASAITDRVLERSNVETWNRYNLLTVKINNALSEAKPPADAKTFKQALAHYYYELLMKLYNTLKPLSEKERSQWCSENIYFADYEDKKLRKIGAEFRAGFLMLNLIAKATSSILDVGLTADETRTGQHKRWLLKQSAFAGDRENYKEAIDVSVTGTLWFTSEDNIYNSLKDVESLHLDDRNKLVDLRNRWAEAVSGHRKYLSVFTDMACYDSHNERQSSAKYFIDVDVTELHSLNSGDTKLIPAIANMSMETIVKNLNQAKPSPRVWAHICYRAYNAVQEVVETKTAEKSAVWDNLDIETDEGGDNE